MAAYRDIITGVLGQYYQLRQDEETIWDYQPEGNGLWHAYLLTYVRKGHEYCCCMRGRRLRYYVLHDPRTGTWPNNYRVTDLRAGELVQYLGDDYYIERQQYVLIRPSQGRVVVVGGMSSIVNWPIDNADLDTESDSE